jgi:hypothetical protein
MEMDDVVDEPFDPEIMDEELDFRDVPLDSLCMVGHLSLMIGKAM